MQLTFEKFSKIPRLNKTCTITEKIDGTNAQIVFGEDGNLIVGSRTREIFPNGTHGKGKGCDNYGFARWVHDNRDRLFDYLGEGRHYGEWAGLGIQRGYGLSSKHFFLFNTFRFGTDENPIPDNLLDAGLSVVPILYSGEFSTNAIQNTMEMLRNSGSFIADFDNPEGIIVHHDAARQYFKVTFEYDDGKWKK